MRKRYGSDLSDEHGAEIRPDVEPESKGPGRPRTLDRREVVNGSRYLVRTGCPWELRPKDFPHQTSGRYDFDTWTRDGTLSARNERLCERVRAEAGREPLPSGGSSDRQPVQTTEAGGANGTARWRRSVPSTPWWSPPRAGRSATEGTASSSSPRSSRRV